MAIYEERIPRMWLVAAIFAVVFVFSFPVWHLGERDFTRFEGEYATAVTEFQGFPPRVTLHGLPSHEIQPLYPLLCLTLRKIGLPMDLSMRLISLLALLGTTAIVVVTCYRGGGVQAAAAGGAVMLSSLILASRSMDGCPQLLTMLILYSGWLCWFNIGLGRGNWDFAWVLVGLFAALAFYNAGFSALLYFLIPLCFQRRPLTVWPKIRRIGFVSGFLLVFVVFLLWRVPFWSAPAPAVESSRFFFGEYLQHVFVMTTDIFLRFLPWSLMLWAPFCAALIPLDSNPLFGQFHRILFLILAILLCLNPNSTNRDMVYLAPILATMIGLNYWIVVRRYGHKYAHLFTIAGILLLVLALGAALFMILPTELIRKVIPVLHDLSYRDLNPILRSCIFGEIALAFLLGTLVLVLNHSRKNPVWMLTLFSFAGFLILFWAVVNPYKAWDHSRKNFGSELKMLISHSGMNDPNPDTPILFKDSRINGLYLECYYAGYPVRTTDATAETPLPQTEPVFLITARVPTIPDRTWRKIFDNNYKGERLFVYKGLPVRKDSDFDDESDE